MRNINIHDLADRGRLEVISHPAGDFKPLMAVNPDDRDCRGGEGANCFISGMIYY